MTYPLTYKFTVPTKVKIKEKATGRIYEGAGYENKITFGCGQFVYCDCPHFNDFYSVQIER